MTSYLARLALRGAGLPATVSVQLHAVPHVLALDVAAERADEHGQTPLVGVAPTIAGQRGAQVGQALPGLRSDSARAALPVQDVLAPVEPASPHPGVTVARALRAQLQPGLQARAPVRPVAEPHSSAPPDLMPSAGTLARARRVAGSSPDATAGPPASAAQPKSIVQSAGAVPQDAVGLCPRTPLIAAPLPSPEAVASLAPTLASRTESLSPVVSEPATLRPRLPATPAPTEARTAGAAAREPVEPPPVAVTIGRIDVRVAPPPAPTASVPEPAASRGFIAYRGLRNYADRSLY